MENASKALVIAGAILISILLITIGIVLVNSGKGVAETGTANMNSQKIQAFNSQFTAYEGKKKGSEIRSLVNLVNASNATDPEHTVGVFIDHNYQINSIGQISSSKTYNVKLHYAGSSSTTQNDLLKSNFIIAGNHTNLKTENGYIMAIEIIP